jgi:hypothetical protein
MSNSACSPNEKSHPEVVLDFLERLAQRRLRNKQPPGSARDVAFFGDGEHILNFPQA